MMLALPSWFLPAGDQGLDTFILEERDGVCSLAPRLDADRLAATCQDLRAAARRLRQMPVQRIITAIDAAARRFRDPAHVDRHRVIRGLTALGGLSEPMAVTVLDRMSELWLRAALEVLLEQEFGNAGPVEGFVSGPRAAPARAGGPRAHARAPHLGFHVFAGNVPGVNVTSVVRALLVRSATIGKCASSETVLAPAFARALAEEDPDVGACVAIATWKGGDAELEAAVLDHAGLVVHYGDADSIASLRSRIRPGTLFVEHGPKLSFLLLDAAAAHLPDQARDAALAVALFDQQGCVSPQMAWVVGSPDDARSFAASLAAQLQDLEHQLPRGRITSGEAASIRELRATAEFQAIAGRDIALWEGDNLAWTVILDDGTDFAGSCLNRSIIIRHAPSIDHVLRAAEPVRPFLQSVGIAGFQDQRDFVATALADVGVTRISSIASMPWPPAHWHHDGRGPLRELVRWIDLAP